MAKSGKKFYVYSTLGQDVHYASWAHSAKGEAGDIQTQGPGVTIKGGTGVIDRRLETPEGVLTIVSEEAMDFLRQDQVFLLHEKNGFITVREEKVDPEVAAAEMERRDGSAQLTEHDFEEGKAPTVAGQTVEEIDAPKPKTGAPKPPPPSSGRA